MKNISKEEYEISYCSWYPEGTINLIRKGGRTAYIGLTKDIPKYLQFLENDIVEFRREYCSIRTIESISGHIHKENYPTLKIREAEGCVDVISDLRLKIIGGRARILVWERFEGSSKSDATKAYHQIINTISKKHYGKQSKSLTDTKLLDDLITIQTPKGEMYFSYKEQQQLEAFENSLNKVKPKL